MRGGLYTRYGLDTAQRYKTHKGHKLPKSSPKAASQRGRTLQHRVVRISELEVSIEPSILRTPDGLTTIYAVGLCGQSGYAHTLQLPCNPNATLQEIERDLDTHCHHIAWETAGREKVRLLTEKLS